MCNLRFRLLIIILVISCPIIIGFTVVQQNNLREKLQEILYKYELLRKIQQEKNEKENTWVLKGGIWEKYQFLESIANISEFEKFSDTQVFIYGPHGSFIDRTSNLEFGHYNPKFIKSIHQSLELLINDSNFKIGAQLLYNKRLKPMAQIFYKAYLFIHKYKDKNRDLNDDNYLEGLKLKFEQYTKEDKSPIKIYYELELGFGELITDQGYDLNVSTVAPGFWFRRYIDGTDQEFFNLLNLVIDNFDKDFKKAL